MARLPAAAVLAGLLALPGAGPVGAAAAADEVTIYRCVGADGQVSLGNLPCRDGERQETRQMVRPVDAPPPPPRPEPAAARSPAPAGPEVRYVVVSPPQPIYECIRPDGSTYESDTGIGETRAVPTWGGAWPVRRPGHRPPGYASRGATVPADSRLSVPPTSGISIPSNPPRPDPVGTGPRPRPRPGPAYGAPAIVERDPCHPLPQAEACARLRDRRDDVRRRFFAAQPTLRDTLRVEERGLVARIERDCRMD